MRIDEERGGTRFFQAVLAARRVELDGRRSPACSGDGRS